MALQKAATILRDAKEKIILVYAFNATGKTRLSVAYKDITKTPEEGNHTGVYYNAFSEDLFTWDNGDGNKEGQIRFNVAYSSLNRFHGSLSEMEVREKLTPYKPKYDFYFRFDEKDPEKGINHIVFFNEGDDKITIKISRGEERIFVWCLFLALFEVEGWADKQTEHFFIDDPVSSLDDHNIFVTAATIHDLIESQYPQRKIVITTHHIGLFSILADWLTKGEKSDKFKKDVSLFILNRRGEEIVLETPGKQVFLYHLHLLQTLKQANAGQLYTYHFALLRQLLENIASFLGAGHFGYVLSQIGITDTGDVARIITSLSHKTVYYFQTELMNTDNAALFRSVFEPLVEKYQFKV